MKTSAVLSVTNDLMLTSDEVSVGGRVKGDLRKVWSQNADLGSQQVEFGYMVWFSFPERLIGLAASYRHYWDPTNQRWGYDSSQGSSSYSFVTGALFYHRSV